MQSKRAETKTASSGKLEAAGDVARAGSPTTKLNHNTESPPTTSPTIELSVNRTRTGKLPETAGLAEWAQYNDGFINARLDVSGLARVLQAGHGICCKLKPRSRRKGENYVSAQHIGLDFDTQDERSSLTTLATDPFIAQYGALIYTTSSHTPDYPRARVLFVLDEPITDPAEYRRLVVALLGRYGTDPDQRAKDPARIWFGALGCDLVQLGNVLPVAAVRALVEAQAPAAPRIPSSVPEGESVINAYNAAHPITEVLADHGYTIKGGRAIRPGGSSQSVNITDGRSFHHSSNDVLASDYWRTPFDIYCQLEHAGDVRAAVKAAAAALGITRTKPPTPAATSTPAAQPPAQGERAAAKARKVSSEDLADFFVKRGYSFAENELTGTLYVNGRPLVDADEARWRNHLRDAGLGAYITHARDVMVTLANAGMFNPVKDFIEAEPWDGLDHIDYLASFITDRDGIFRLLLERWMLGAIDRVYNAGAQNKMLVLVGPQGIGKSRIVATLARGLDSRYFIEDAIRPDDKDAHIALTSVWIWEVSELGATTRRADREALKAYITKARVNVRRPYDRYPVDAPAITNFIGTLNNDQSGFLADPTGERRFMVCDLAAIDWSYSQQVNIPQLWAQAKGLYDRGHRGTFAPDELARVNVVNARFYGETVAQSGLDLVIELAPGEFTSTDELVKALKEQGYSGNDNQLAKDISDYMARRIAGGDPIAKMRKRVHNASAAGSCKLWGWEGVRLV